ncbi:VOC family protein [Cohnella caldifontis]|uniref:VOC family protein n=1 Tax=Cohnella caldifontis TaxID=3027471 RepID=UPI0023EE24C0|nr:VOC family protein [Cohnella sp. YIM B05605]
MAIRLSPYLVTNGNGQEAVKWYEEALSAKVISLQTFGEMPGDPDHPVPEEAKDRVLHAALQVGETVLMLSDTFPGNPHQVGNHVAIAVVVDDAAQAKTIFDKLAQGGNVEMPLQETFWSPAFGMVTDKFGVSFQISTERPG